MLIKDLTMKAYGKLEVYLHAFAAVAFHVDEWLDSLLAHFTFGKKEPSRPIA
jgi:hypothetical protein